MASTRPSPDQNQGQLLDVAMPGNDARNTQITVIEDPSTERLPTDTAPITEIHTAEVADRRYRAVLLLRTLSHISNERESQGYVKWDETPEGRAEFADIYHEHAPLVRAEKEFQSKVAPEKARETFALAFKLGRGKHAPDLGEHEIDDEFTAFHIKFASHPDAPAERAKLRKQLRKTLQVVDGPLATGDTYEVGPPKPESIVRTPEDERELLSSRNRMIAIRDDERAGFMPTNHNEKTQAFTLLTFLDPKEYPGGVYEHLRIVAKHQYRVYKEDHGATHREAMDEGKRSVISILNEYGDHAASALESVRNLQKAKAVLDESPNPAITLAEALEDNPEIEAGFNELIRYVDLLKWRETGEASMPFDPLGPKRNEDPSVLREGQNKRLDDPYTGVVRKEKAAEYVDEQHHKVRVITARKLINEAIENELKSYDFWANSVLASVRGSYKRDALDVLAAVQASSTAA